MIDYKKTQKNLYSAQTTATVVDVPKMLFIMIDGRGNPNTSALYLEAVEILYGLSYTIKMSKKSGSAPKGYFEYVMPPLEGLWWIEEIGEMDFSGKDKFCWTSMIRQPEFVTEEDFESAKKEFAEKKSYLDLSRAKFSTFSEGLCAQILHIGTYDEEPATLEVMNKFIEDSGYKLDISETRHHHEIYLSDPRRTTQRKLKTILRQPIK